LTTLLPYVKIILSQKSFVKKGQTMVSKLTIPGQPPEPGIDERMGLQNQIIAEVISRQNQMVSVLQEHRKVIEGLSELVLNQQQQLEKEIKDRERIERNIKRVSERLTGIRGGAGVDGPIPYDEREPSGDSGTSDGSEPADRVMVGGRPSGESVDAEPTDSSEGAVGQPERESGEVPSD
jgi:TolA-binding protein